MLTVLGNWAADLVALAAPQLGEHVLDVACWTWSRACDAGDGSVICLDLNVWIKVVPAQVDESMQAYHEGYEQFGLSHPDPAPGIKPD